MAKGILNMDKSELAWIDGMLKEEAWMKMLVRLRASHKDSALLTYFLTQMSKAGHHSLLHGQTDNFGVFHGLLGHMLEELAIASQGREEEARRAKARKACLSAPRTFCYGKVREFRAKRRAGKAQYSQRRGVKRRAVRAGFEQSESLRRSFSCSVVASLLTAPRREDAIIAVLCCFAPHDVRSSHPPLMRFSLVAGPAREAA